MPYVPNFELIDDNIAVMRNRVYVKNVKEYFGEQSDNDNENEADNDDKKYHGRRKYRSGSAARGMLFYLLLVVVAILFLVLVKLQLASPEGTAAPDNHKSSPAESKVVETKAVEAKAVESKATPDVSEPKTVERVALSSDFDWSKCDELPPKPGAKVVKKAEPLWLPAYPSSLPTLPYSNFIEALTGVKTGAKSYYRQSPTLKRCHYPRSEVNIHAVTCEIVHPIVPCQRPHPSQQASSFGNVVLLALRNPMTAFPAEYQTKAEAYHGQKGQISKEDWVKFRDEWVGNGPDSHMMKQWKQFIMEWRDMNPYHVEEYIPYEYWLDEKKGPNLVTRLSTIFKEEGLPVRYNKDESTELKCLWYKHMYSPLVEEEKKRKEDGWYEHEYTKEQYEMMATGLDTFVEELKQKRKERADRPGDSHLVSILSGYSKAIRAKV